jgi:uncharacterized low-complexity protein
MSAFTPAKAAIAFLAALDAALDTCSVAAPPTDSDGFGESDCGESDCGESDCGESDCDESDINSNALI